MTQFLPMKSLLALMSRAKGISCFYSVCIYGIQSQAGWSQAWCQYRAKVSLQAVLESSHILTQATGSYLRSVQSMDIGCGSPGCQNGPFVCSKRRYQGLNLGFSACKHVLLHANMATRYIDYMVTCPQIWKRWLSVQHDMCLLFLAHQRQCDFLQM